MRISKLICPFLILGVTSLALADRSSNKGKILDLPKFLKCFMIIFVD